jgi:hypothetical protein
MADVVIKRDPEAVGASPSASADEDIYEDAGDLEFNTDPKYQRLYLARLPKYIWDNWHDLDDDEEIQLGTIRQSHVLGSDGKEQVLLFGLLLLLEKYLQVKRSSFKCCSTRTYLSIRVYRKSTSLTLRNSLQRTRSFSQSKIFPVTNQEQTQSSTRQLRICQQD